MSTNYYIIVAADQPETGETARDVYDSLMLEGIWGFGENTANRKRLQVGDRLVFYLARSGGQVFAGTAEVASLPEKTGRKGYRSEYWFKMKNINKWEEPKSARLFLDKLEFIGDPERWGVYFQGGSRIISEEDYLTIIAKGESITKPTLLPEKDQTEFVLEKYLEDFIISNWDKINFGYNLELFKDENENIGQQYYTGEVGYIDILAVDRDNGDFVVIELKKGKESDKIVGQTLRYMGWVQKNLCETKQKVRGIIVVNSRDKKLNYALSRVSDIEVREYKIDFQLSKELK